MLLLVLFASPWRQIQAQEAVKLTASDGGPGFGFSAAISGDYALIGAPGVNEFAGAAYLFELQGDGSWLEAAILTESGADIEELFGYSVAISGDRALIGAVSDNEKGAGAGAAFIFERQTNGSWLEAAKLTASDAAVDDFFGYSVALAGDRALIGAYEDEFNGNFSGSAFVFERQTDGSWLEVAKLGPGDGADFDGFGSSVSISGDRALVGAICADEEVGAAYAFERQENGSWLEVDKLSPDISVEEAYYFGSAVSLDGERAFIGAPNDGSFEGAGFIFERQGDGSWVEVMRLAGSETSGEDLFGISVALSGELAVAGTPSEDGTGNIGEAFVFQRQEDGSWLEIDILTATDSALDDRFGTYVALSNEHLLVAAKGAAYVFDLDAYATDVEQPFDFLSAYHLSQNYPNPFSSSTTITFNVPAESTLRLAVYDLLGRIVASLADRRFAPGNYGLTFHADGLPGGLYMYRLETSQGAVTRSMLITR